MMNPLRKRLPRELKNDIGKYIVIFIFIAAIISFVSGFLVADNSMIEAYNKGFDTYNIEDGNFELPSKGDQELISTLEKENLTIYEKYYIEEKTTGIESTLRIYKNREEINKTCLMSGKLPINKDEIAIDRMYGLNNHISVGDTIYVGGEGLKVSGFVALSDYSTLFSDDSDMMFDAVKFGVAVMTEDGFDKLGDAHLHYRYSFKYNNPPDNDKKAAEMSDNFLKVLAENAMITDYIPQYSNQAIHFAGDDMGGDKSMFTVFLYIVILIIAFVFAVTTSNTISKEASVIGTLRASGYTKAEIICHYLEVPMIIMIIAGIIGNILGYTCFKGIFAGLYYNSYSLPTYVTLWNTEAFISTTAVPLAIMFLINLSILVYKMRLSPLKFLRNDLSRSHKKKAFKLNTKIKIFTRFRIRIIFQNMSNYFILFIGILFANFILFFGFLFGPLIDNYQDDIVNNMICDYQYILKMPAETKMEGAEKFAVTSLSTVEGKLKSEEVTVYGVKENSNYIDLDFDDEKVYVSDGYAKKYDLSVGDEITLDETYGSKEYNFKIGGVYDYPSSHAIFMNKSIFNEVFGEDTDYFNGYFSNSTIDDIDNRYIATTITKDDLTKVSRQLDLSMGSIMSLFTIFGCVMFVLLIYLLAKQVIEKNAQSISMVKILGYNNGEINRLYILSTSIVAMISILVSLPICNMLMKKLVVVALSDFSGWLPYYVEPGIFPKIIVLGILCYILVAVTQMWKIKKISKSDALKNVE